MQTTGMDARWSTRSEVELWITGSLLDVFLFVPSLLLFFGSRPGTNGVGMGFYHLWGHKWRWIFPVCQIRRKVAMELYRSVLGLMGSYDCVSRMIVSLFVSLSFFSPILAFAAQEVCAEREV